ncbi:hypothetical protein VCR3J2_420180 [Vibrio coralliirubri]|nr:hypothetical protein VCR6J2_370069 [Vibrio coralliirubri]CDT49249.1 hypothetical protein VCR1J2_590329 [Vibrio coralliirubri]CDT73364.1 hypothetical protein VCR26J2_350812 [Vibrio coralliirubri]CDT96948.1 hypothetical protein VCR3J2_420180 [Vibrio coralliirubri]CDU03087.1 hypothetical protein VCR8J2_850308 [Vibrio coralliirubri]
MEANIPCTPTFPFTDLVHVQARQQNVRFLVGRLFGADVF